MGGGVEVFGFFLLGVERFVLSFFFNVFDEVVFDDFV